MNLLCFRNLKLLVSLALCAGLFSCSASPEALEGSAPPPRMPAGGDQSPAHLRRAIPSEVAEAPGPGPESEAPLYSLAPAALPPEAIAGPRPGHEGDSMAVDVDLRQPEVATTLEDSSYASLVEEIRKRLTTQWSALSGGLGETSAPDARTKLARRLVALTFLLEDRQAEDPHFEEALAYARAQDGEATGQLLVAAYLSEAGRLEEARDLIRKLFGLDQGTRVIAPSEPFVLSNVNLARSIEGPGQFVPAAPIDIAPGKAVLLYGEFENFLSICEEPGDERESTYRRCFSASLKLISASGKEVDYLNFLPESRGVHVGSAPVEIVNFWARYRIPAALKSGKYTLVVEGKDVLGEKSASASLELEIPRSARKPAAATQAEDSEDS
jgi:hypothetical protein